MDGSLKCVCAAACYTILLFEFVLGCVRGVLCVYLWVDAGLVTLCYICR